MDLPQSCTKFDIILLPKLPMPGPDLFLLLYIVEILIISYEGKSVIL